ADVAPRLQNDARPRRTGADRKGAQQRAHHWSAFTDHRHSESDARQPRYLAGLSASSQSCRSVLSDGERDGELTRRPAGGEGNITMAESSGAATAHQPTRATNIGSATPESLPR